MALWLYKLDIINHLLSAPRKIHRKETHYCHYCFEENFDYYYANIDRDQQTASKLAGNQGTFGNFFMYLLLDNRLSHVGMGRSSYKIGYVIMLQNLFRLENIPKKIIFFKSFLIDHGNEAKRFGIF